MAGGLLNTVPEETRYMRKTLSALLLGAGTLMARNGEDVVSQPMTLAAVVMIVIGAIATAVLIGAVVTLPEVKNAFHFGRKSAGVELHPKVS